jgi:hypothetical protein
LASEGSYEGLIYQKKWLVRSDESVNVICHKLKPFRIQMVQLEGLTLSSRMLAQKLLIAETRIERTDA